MQSIYVDKTTWKSKQDECNLYVHRMIYLLSLKTLGLYKFNNDNVLYFM